jgi:two-component system NtrC family response regulator
MARILVIDDNPRFRAMMREVLEGVGHQVTAAADCESGMSAFRHSPADLAIVDGVMPGKGATTTIGDLHQEFPDLKIIAVAAATRANPAMNCLPCGRRAPHAA